MKALKKKPKILMLVCGRIDENLLHLLKSSAWLIRSNAVLSIFSLIQAIILARWLGIAIFGLYGLIVAYASAINQLVDFRVWETATKYVTEFWIKEDREMALGAIKLCYMIDFLTGILAFILVVLTSKIAATFLIHQPEISKLITLYALSLIISTIDDTSQALLRVFDQFKWLSIYYCIVSASKFIFVTAFLLLGYGLKGVIWGFIFASAIGAALLNIKAFRIVYERTGKHFYRGNLKAIKTKLKEILWFLINTNLNASIKMIARHLDSLILGFFRSPADVGYYKIASQFGQLYTFFSNPAYNVIYPKVAELWTKKKLVELRALIKNSSRIMAFILIPILVTLIIFGNKIIYLFFGKDYLPAYLPLIMMSIGITFSGIVFWQRSAILSIGRADISTYIGLFLILIQIILSIILVPAYGAHGSAFIFMLQNLIGNSIAIWIFCKKLNLNLSKQEVIT